MYVVRTMKTYVKEIYRRISKVYALSIGLQFENVLFSKFDFKKIVFKLYILRLVSLLAAISVLEL